MPAVRVLDRGAAVGRDAEPARRLEVHVRRRLACATSSEETVARKSAARPDTSSTRSMSTRFDDEASPSGNRSPSLRTVSTAPGTSGSRSP